MGSEIFRVPILNFHIYVLIVDKFFYVRGKELCENLGYKVCHNVIRSNFPHQKMYLRDFGVKFNSIRGNSLFVSIPGAFYIIRKSNLSCFDKFRYIHILRVQLQRLAAMKAIQENEENSKLTTEKSGESTSEDQNQTTTVNLSSDKEALSHGFSNEVIIVDDIKIEMENEQDNIDDGVQDFVKTIDISNNATSQIHIEDDVNIEMENQQDNIDNGVQDSEKTIDISNNELSQISDMLKKIENLQRKNFQLFQEILKKINLYII